MDKLTAVQLAPDWEVAGLLPAPGQPWIVMGRAMVLSRLYQPMGIDYLGEFPSIAAWHAYKRIALTRVAGFEISTVWIGTDMAFGDGPPLIYETMIFTRGAWEPPREDGSWEDAMRWRPDAEIAPDPGEMYRTLAEEFDGRQWRWSSEPDARAGHQLVVNLLWAALPLGMVAALPAPP